MILNSVLANGAKIHPARNFFRREVRPVVIVLFVLNENGALIFVPEHVVVVAELAGVDAHKTRVHLIFTQGLDHVAAVIVATDVSYKRAFKAQPSKCHGSIAGVAHTRDHLGVLKWNLRTKRDRQPLLTVFFVLHLFFFFEQPDERIGYDVANAEYVKLVHCPSFSLYIAYVYCATAAALNAMLSRSAGCQGQHIHSPIHKNLADFYERLTINR